MSPRAFAKRDIYLRMTAWLFQAVSSLKTWMLWGKGLASLKTWAVNWCLFPIRTCGSLGWTAVSWVMAAIKVIQLRRAAREAALSPTLFPPPFFTTVPTNPFACRTKEVSSILTTKGGRPSGAAASAKFIHCQKTIASQGAKNGAARRTQKWTLSLPKKKT